MTYLERVIDYHHRTKHHAHRPSKSLGYMDWATKPEPFRYYDGATKYRLPLEDHDQGIGYINLYRRDGNPAAPITFNNIGGFLRLSLGLSAWKMYSGESWALRMNPSSGNLHAEEAYLVLPPLKELADSAGVFHYDPNNHQLEKRMHINNHLWNRLLDHCNTDGFFIALSTIYWREAWKYGERAFRYCNLDTGHAIACLSLAANLFGWKVHYLRAMPSDQLDQFIGLAKTNWLPNEAEEGELLCFVHPAHAENLPDNIPADLISELSQSEVMGEPNRLSADHHRWDVIDDVSKATRNEGKNRDDLIYPEAPFIDGAASGCNAADIIRQRRSGQSYDGVSGIRLDHFFGLLDRTIPREGHAPFDIKLGVISTDLLIFAHRVAGLESGLYYLIRDGSDPDDIRKEFDNDLAWEKVGAAPDQLPLYLLSKGDYRRSHP